MASFLCRLLLFELFSVGFTIRLTVENITTLPVNLNAHFKSFSFNTSDYSRQFLSISVPPNYLIYVNATGLLSFDIYMPYYFLAQNSPNSNRLTLMINCTFDMRQMVNFVNFTFTTAKNRVFEKVETFPIQAGAIPLIFRLEDIKNGLTYCFVGNPKLTMFVVKYSSSFYSDFLFYQGDKNKPKYIGKYSNWNRTLETDKICIYNAGLKRTSLNFGSPHENLITIADSSDLSKYTNPKFIQISNGNNKNINLVATSKSTFVTLTTSSPEKNEHVYLLNPKFSNDVQLIVLKGFVTPTISEERILGRYNASTMGPNFHMIVEPTKSLILAKGKLYMDMTEEVSYDPQMLNFENNTIGLVVNEKPKGVSWGFKKAFDENDDWYQYSFIWKSSSPGAKLVLESFSDEQIKHFLPNTTASAQAYGETLLTLKGVATVEYRIIRGRKFPSAGK